MFNIISMKPNYCVFFKEYDLQKRTLTELQQDHNQLKEVLANREKLIQVNLIIHSEIIFHCTLIKIKIL